MQLCAILTKDDLASVIEQLTPLRVVIRPRRVITLGRPTKVDLVAGRGLRVRGDARFTWDACGIAIPVTLRTWQVLLVPSFATRGQRHVLAFEPVLEELDFKRMPMFLDERIADAVASGLAAQRTKLAWDFEKHLSLLAPLSAKVEPASELTLGPTGGTITVTDADVRLTLDFALRITRGPEEAEEASSHGSPESRKRAPGLRDSV